MRIIEHRDTLVLTNGEGSPRRHVLAQTLIAAPFVLAVLYVLLAAAMHGWMWGWLSLLAIPPALYGLWWAWHRECHATLEIDGRDGRVRLERRFATRVEEVRLGLGDVAALEVETHKCTDGESSFVPVLALQDGRRIVLGPKRLDRMAIERAAHAVRDRL